jgi:hypothetical protein
MEFGDFVADQFGVGEKIYHAFGLSMSEKGETRMRVFIADNPKESNGRTTTRTATRTTTRPRSSA